MAEMSMECWPACHEGVSTVSFTLLLPEVSVLVEWLEQNSQIRQLNRREVHFCVHISTIELKIFDLCFGGFLYFREWHLQQFFPVFASGRNKLLGTGANYFLFCQRDLPDLHSVLHAYKHCTRTLATLALDYLDFRWVLAWIIVQSE